MADPSVSSISIDGRFNALVVHFGVSAPHSVSMPMIGALVYLKEVSLDLHDMRNMPYGTLQKLYVREFLHDQLAILNMPRSEPWERALASCVARVPDQGSRSAHGKLQELTKGCKFFPRLPKKSDKSFYTVLT